MARKIRTYTSDTGTLFLILAVAAGLIAAFLVYSTLNSAAPQKTVYITTRTIMPGEEIKNEDLSERTLPASAVQSDAIQSKDEAVGKHVMFGVPKTEVLRKSHISEYSDNPSLTYLVDDGKVAFAIPGDRIVALNQQKGDRINITAVLKALNDAQGMEEPAKAITFVTNAKVLDVIQPVEGGTQGVLVVELTPKDAERLSLALVNGDIFVSTNKQNSQISPSSSGLSELWNQAALPQNQTPLPQAGQ